MSTETESCEGFFVRVMRQKFQKKLENQSSLSLHVFFTQKSLVWCLCSAVEQDFQLESEYLFCEETRARNLSLSPLCYVKGTASRDFKGLIWYQSKGIDKKSTKIAPQRRMPGLFFADFSAHERQLTLTVYIFVLFFLLKTFRSVPDLVHLNRVPQSL